MSKHTPGPWLHRAKSDSVHKPPPEQPYQFGGQIFRFHDEQGPSDADLALILAAPDLLEALRVFVSAAYPVTTEINPRGHAWSEAYLDQALDNARAAIAKAEGDRK